MDMIERVARGIYEGRNGAGCKPWSIQPKAHKGPYLADAFAAIKAMHEPTEEMVSRGDVYADGPGYAHKVWQEMIAVALTPSRT